MIAVLRPGPTILKGRVAAPGFAAGRIVRLEAGAGHGGTAPRPPGAPADEEAAFRAALDEARRAVADLLGRQEDPDAAALLEFQLAMLEDDVLTDPVTAAIAARATADAAWTDRLDEEIAGYRAADDEYFRARASDLEDIRDRVLRLLRGQGSTAAALPPDAIAVARDLAPSRFLEIRWQPGQGIALHEGSHSGHVAILARARGIPMLIGVDAADALPGTAALLDAEHGILTLAPDPSTAAAFEGRRRAGLDRDRAASALALEPALTASGDRVAVLLNIGGPDDLAGLDPRLADGIGLVRTEFLFHGRTLADLPGEAKQLAAYAQILAWADGRPVTIRTLDAGGDKPIPGYTLDREANPFLGLRGVRLSIAHPDVFRTQLRALLRAAALGPLQIMVPMVSVPAEMDLCRRMLDGEAAALDRAGIARGAPRLGMMVEVPATAVTLDLFAADFVSIGSNDLIQYLMAAGRDASAVADLADPLAPAVLRTIRAICAATEELGIPVSLCGDAGGDPAVVPALLDAGLRSLSMGAAAVPHAKAAIRAWRGP
jgi:phosphotransferase system enzyme I (PtsI)